jgi:3-hydroxy-9,10-secoandrosta-1,3,5(10)-triene-9,17-dione monooxygenase reductase component
MSGTEDSNFREVLGYFATGVTVVTAMETSGPVGFTCQAFTSLSLEPQLVGLAPAKSSTSWPRIMEAGAFCVNILSATQEPVCQAFAISGGDKFANIGWHPGVTESPRLANSLAWIECCIELVHDAGDHEFVLGRVVSMEVGTGEPLLFYRGRFVNVA